jgi:LacI family transcriptional regulator
MKKKTKAINIHDIANKANVSHMTVSRVFNNPELVSKKTKEKIIKISKELDYRPNLIAKSMRTNKTNTIGLILPNIINPFFPEIVKGVDDYCKKNHYGIIMVNKEDDYKDKIRTLEILLERKIDGILMIPYGTSGSEKLINDTTMNRKIPMVLIDRYISEINCSYVSSDNFSVAYNATKYLIKMGHNKIAVISQPRTISIFYDRLQGYKQALKSNNITPNKNYIKEYKESIENGYTAAKEILTDNQDITAILTMCDFMAFGVYKYCKENKIDIPNNLSIISIDDIFASALLTPPLTTMAQQKYKMGYTAAKILIDSIKENKLPKKQITLDTILVERESCKSIC